MRPQRGTRAPAAPSPAAPSPAAPAPITIYVAEMNGPYSFIPSPAAVRSDQAIVWKNSDIETHHLVLDDGSIDTGTLAPGTVSQPETVAAGTRTYHCTIHPSMVGTVVVTTASSSAGVRSGAK
jgi:plastocyanin